MGDAAVLPAEKGNALADAEAKKEVTGGGQAKRTQIDDSPSGSDSTPHAASALTDATEPKALSVPGVPKKRNDAVRAAFALLAASPVRRAFAAVHSMLTPARAAFALLAASPVRRAFAAVHSMLTPARAAFLVSTLVALWLSAGQPCRAVWTFTVIAISYLALWTIYLTAAMHPLTVLVSLSYVMLLAISVTHLSSAAGVLLLSLLIDLSLFCWAALVAMHLLHEVLFQDDHLAFIYWGTALLLLPDFFLSYLFGQAIGVLVHPVGVMGMAGFLGYSLSVYVRYKHIRAQ